MALWRSIGGMYRVGLTGADPFGSLLSIEKWGIPVENVEKIDGMQLNFLLRRRDLPAVRRICQKRGDTLDVLEKMGVFWSIRGLLRRPVLVLGLLLIVFLSVWAPGRVFFVFVDGNSSVPSNLILEQARFCGIDFGAKGRDIRSEKIKNALLSQIPELQWVGVNTQGCVAVISVRERTVQEAETPQFQVSSIVAVRDGVIREMTVLQGNPLCAVGQTVKAGQVLISGYTDCGICIQAGNAQGEIYAETLRQFSAVTPTTCAYRGEKQGETKKYSLLIGKKRINLYNSSGISDTECVRIYSEQYLTLPGGFQLPVAIAVEQYISYDTEIQTHPDPEGVLLPFMQDYLRRQMIAGRILTGFHTGTELDGFYRIDGIYGCYEMIGLTRPEERLEDYENYRTDSER